MIYCKAILILRITLEAYPAITSPKDHEQTTNKRRTTAEQEGKAAMPANALPGYYTLTEAAEKLGYISTANFRTDCREGKIPNAVKIGKTWLVPETWVNEQENIDTNGKGNRGIARK